MGLMEEMKSNSDKYPVTLDDLVLEMENNPHLYKHLKIFLCGAEHSKPFDIGSNYLLVNKYGFWLCKLKDINYKDGKIELSLTELNTGHTSVVKIALSDKNPRHILIRWTDIKKLVFQECMDSDQNDNDLLELIED